MEKNNGIWEIKFKLQLENGMYFTAVASTTAVR